MVAQRRSVQSPTQRPPLHTSRGRKHSAADNWRYSARVPSVFLQSWGSLLVVVHTLSSIVLCGASVHQAVLAIQLLRRRKVRLSLLATYGWTTLLSYLSTMIAGVLLYPRYRILIRAVFLDRYAPWASNLFDFKENLATLGLPLSVGALLIARSLADESALATKLLPSTKTPTEGTGEPSTRMVIWTYAVMALGTALVCLSNVVAGLLCTAVRGA